MPSTSLYQRFSRFKKFGGEERGLCISNDIPGVPKIWGTLSGVPTIRTVVFGVLYWGLCMYVFTYSGSKYPRSEYLDMEFG